MNMCSKKAYLKRRQADNHEDDVDTNIFQVKFDCLKENAVKIHQGDPISCQQCEIVFNKHSKLTKDIQNEQFGKQQWICEFCNHENFIQIEPEEIPTKEDTIYLVQSAQEQQKMDIEGTDNSVVFCIDTSGSMSTTVEIKGKVNYRHGISQEEYEMLKQFIEPGDEHQYLPQFNSNKVTHVSRKQCVLAAIEQQINDLKQKNPNKIVGLVTFNNEVVVYGDGNQDPLTITGDRLFKQEEILKLMNEHAKELMSQPLQLQAQQLLNKFEKIQEKGQTALGPALLAALELAKVGKPGSMVIICTDGLANLGLGSLENELNKQFYEEVGQFAQQCGVVLSLVTIKGEGCKIDILGSLVEKTNGTVTRVKPEDIGADFANILKDELVATQVELVVRLHRAIKFRNEEDANLATTLKRNIGNATIATQQTFEYQVKNDTELQKDQIELKDLKFVPFQIKINYTNLHGDRLMRVITQLVSTTEVKEEAEEEAEVEVIHRRMAQKTAQLAKKGNYNEAQTFNMKWDGYVQTNTKMNSKESNQAKNNSYHLTNQQLQKAVVKQQIRSSKPIEQHQQQKEQPGMLDRLTAYFKNDDKKAKTVEEIPQKKQQQQQQQQQQSQQQQQQQQQQLKVERKASICSSDEDADMADLMNFEQAKY